MAEQYPELGPGDRREVLEFAASESGRPAYLLEKDIWVVWTLRTLFDAPMGAPLVFKGGTSLSKAHGSIRPWSITVDSSLRIGTSTSPIQARISSRGLRLDLDAAQSNRRVFARQSLEWSERRPHHEGALWAESPHDRRT